MAFRNMPSALTWRSQPSAKNAENTKMRANPLSYPKSAAPYSSKLFKNPTAEYRGCPLWSWNTKLNREQLLRQIDYFEAMGMGGFYMHVRIGLDTEYMGPEFMNLVADCVKYAESKNMLACLYDEDRWPSGAAGGLVVKQHPEFKCKHVLFTPHLYGTISLGGDRLSTSGRACRSEEGFLLATYDIELNETGQLVSSRILKQGEAGRNVWYAYIEPNPSSPWFNDETYIDTLSKDAMAAFIKATHEVYKAKVGDKFGSVVPSMFTDEPQFASFTQLSSPMAGDDVFLPWTDDIAQTFGTAYDLDLVEKLPELVWDLPSDQNSAMRYHFHDYVCERFVTAFMDQIGNWCKNNGLILNGHMMEEPTLQSQTAALGEAMRCYRSLDMPGMDLLLDMVEYNTAKQASSVARQSGVRGTMTEIYGVSHWWFTFEGHKGCGDWQAALGITFRVHHLTWVSMAGEGKRDYPACIGYQSPWFREYPHVEDYFARVGVAMTRGKAYTHVGVIHPIESYWLCFGPRGSGDEQGLRDNAFRELTEWLVHGLVDFDFIAESLLPNQMKGKKIGKKFPIGHCEYDVIIVPNLHTIRSTTLKALRAFARAGGKVLIAGSSPSLVDAVVPKSKPVIEGSNHVFWSKECILHAVENYRDLRVTCGGSATDRLLYQMRQDGDERFVFICNTNRREAYDATIQIKGRWKFLEMSTFTGEEEEMTVQVKKNWTSFPYRFEGCASILLHLLPAVTKEEASLAADDLTLETSTHEIPDGLSLIDVELSEPNVFLLDYAEYKLDDGDWVEATEVLRIDNAIRTKLSLPLKAEAFRQPWSISQEERAPKAQAALRFTFQSSYTVDSPVMLALEDADTTLIKINGVVIPSSGQARPTSWWVDEAITTLPLPKYIIQEGTNTITLEFPFGVLRNVERMYILGSFGVSVSGHDTLIQPLNMTDLGWGDITGQGLPFYAGNITYNCSLKIPDTPEKDDSDKADSEMILSVPHFSTPVLTVHKFHNETSTGTSDQQQQQDSIKIGHIAFEPHTLTLPRHLFSAGSQHRIAITAFGNRFNAFGHLHLPANATILCGPNLWRTEGALWWDGYSTIAMGVLEEPTVMVRRQVLRIGGEEEPRSLCDRVGDGDGDDVSEVRQKDLVQRSSGEWIVVT